MRSTDKDLLILQKELAKVKWPTRASLIEKAMKRDAKKVEERFVEVRVKGVLRQLPAPTARKPTTLVSLYDSCVTFQVKNIPHKNGNYDARVTFYGPYIYGQGANGREREADAKETFRKTIADGLRTEGSDVRNAFFKGATISLQNVVEGVKTELLPLSATGPDSADFQAVAEKFRIWIGNSLRKVDGNIRNSFAKAVRLTEREVDANAPIPGNRRRSG